MDKYKRLASNTAIFAIGTFSSKLLVFALIPFYSRVLTEGQLGIADLIVQTANLLLPLVSAGIANAVIRYGLDVEYDKRHVFTGGLTVILCGYLLFLLASPLLRMALNTPKLQKMQDYLWLVLLFVLTSCLRSLCSNFVRSRHLVRLYAFDGLLATVLVIAFNLLFLGVFRLGVIGYVMATILSDVCSSLFLFFTAHLYRFVGFPKMEWPVLGSMLRYAVPLIPSTVFWWITNVSDHFLVTGMVGAEANGVYVISYKLPTILTLVSGIFLDAWQISAVTEDRRDHRRFFSNVFSAYSAVIFTGASGLILLAKPLVHLLVLGSEAYYPAWQYVPFLLLATAFSCFSLFLGSVYMLEQRSIRTLVTTGVGALINIVCNLLLIPRFGVMGAAFATFFSYFCVFFLRIFDTRRFIKINWHPVRFLFCLLLLLAQSTVLLLVSDLTQWILLESLLCLAVIAVNLRQLLLNLKRLLCRKRAD